MSFVDVVKKIVAFLKSGVTVNTIKQNSCVNSPTVIGDNNSVQIGADIKVSKEMPQNPKEGDFWLHLTDENEEKSK